MSIECCEAISELINLRVTNVVALIINRANRIPATPDDLSEAYYRALLPKIWSPEETLDIVSKLFSQGYNLDMIKEYLFYCKNHF
jgi:propanediol dehydratase small subunit